MLLRQKRGTMNRIIKNRRNDKIILLQTESISHRSPESESSETKAAVNILLKRIDEKGNMRKGFCIDKVLMNKAMDDILRKRKDLM